jgi:hypothetical protein
MQINYKKTCNHKINFIDNYYLLIYAVFISFFIFTRDRISENVYITIYYEK